MTSHISRVLASAAEHAREALGRQLPLDAQESCGRWRPLQRRATRGRKKGATEDEVKPWAWQAVKDVTNETVRSVQPPLFGELADLNKEDRPELRHQHTGSTTASAGDSPSSVINDFEEEEDDTEPHINIAHRSLCSRCSTRSSACQQVGKTAMVLTGTLTCWQLDALELARTTDWQPLRRLSMHLFKELGLIKHFNLDARKLSCFLAEVERGYNRHTPYHNSAHAASVTHSMHALLELGGVLRAVDTNDFEYTCEELRLACLLAAVIHDYQHKGVNNDFLIKTSDERAIRYNDKHVNEQHHVSAACALLQRPECNFLADSPPDRCRRLRTLVIDLVLCTDVSTTKPFLESFEELLRHRCDQCSGLKPASQQEATMILQAAMKCADVGHLALEWNMHKAWVKLLEAEFFEQGDREKTLGMDVSFLMDRDKKGASETQVGFFDHVALPLFDAMSRACPGTRPMFEAARENRCRWQALEGNASS